MKYRIPVIAGTALLALSLVGCNKFLDKNPDDRTQINSVPAAKELMVSAYCQYAYNPLFEYRSDNVVDKGTRFTTGRNIDTDIYLHAEAIQSTYQDSPQGFWRESYKAIAVANQTLFDLERTEAKGRDADAVRGEAYMARAYAMYMLAQCFTVPYDPATAATDQW